MKEERRCASVSITPRMRVPSIPGNMCCVICDRCPSICCNSTREFRALGHACLYPAALAGHADTVALHIHKMQWWPLKTAGVVPEDPTYEYILSCMLHTPYAIRWSMLGQKRRFPHTIEHSKLSLPT